MAVEEPRPLFTGLSGPDDPAIIERGRAARRRIWWILLAAIVVVLLATVVLGLTTGPDAVPHNHPPGWARTAGLVLGLAGLAIEILAIVLAIRARLTTPGQSLSPLASLTRLDRRVVRAQLRGRRPFAATDLPYLRRMARQSAAQGWLPWLLTGLALLQIGGALDSFTATRLIVAAVLLALLGTIATLVLRDVRAARTFLRRHPTDTA